MSYLKKILKTLAELGKVLLFKWLILFIKLIILFIRRMLAVCRRGKLPRAERREVNRHCVPIRAPVYYKPDPLLYCQYFLIDKGLAVTWDNPDIRLKKNNLYVDSNTLEADTEYEIEARIWNNSKDAPAPDLPVLFSYLDFGIGTVPIHIGETFTDLGVKGGPKCPAYATMKWRTPASSGHYCLQVLLKWSDDAEPNNNLGQENTNVGVFHSPAEFTFSVTNRKKHSDRIRFEVDTYQLPEREDCRKAKRLRNGTGTLLERHRRQFYPVPPGWTVEITPEIISLESNETGKIHVKITSPDGFSGKKQFNVNGFDIQNNLVGGVTLIAKSNS